MSDIKTENMWLMKGDCLERMKEIPDNSVDSVITDPPYGLSFMGKKWDYDVPSAEKWAECLRVLKPGGHLLAFSGTRTLHRMAVNIEDAGFEIRDMIAWVYGSGFPKSLDVSKAIDKVAGVERERYELPAFGGMFSDDNGTTYVTTLSNTPTTEAAFQWQGWGTALKPALEPITVARKPFECTVAENVLTHGVGAMNIDVCRVGNSGSRTNSSQPRAERNGFVKGFVGGTTTKVHDQGRWPANLIHDGSEDVLAAFPDAKGQQGKSNDSQRTQVNCYGATSDTGKEYTPRIESDKSAARFFYCAKSSKKDRGEGNNHPTVKPFDLMAYLCRLVTPPNGVILDPFMGSGSTGKAAVTEGFRFIGIEMDDKYFEIAKNRIMSA